jgi:hypothetical protein
MVLQWSSKRSTISPQRCPQRSGVASTPDHLRQRPGPFIRPSLELQTKTDLWVDFGEWSGGRDFQLAARQSLRYWPRACHSWRSITRSEALRRSTLAVTSPTGVIGWMTGPFNLKCSSHMSRRGSKNRIGWPARSTDAISEPLYRLQRTQA